MSETWGAGLFQNASGEVIKNYYMAMLKSGASDDEAYGASLEVLKDCTDEESRSNAIIGLAYTMWKYGRINDNVRDLLNEALDYENRRVWNSKNQEKQRSKNIVKLQNDLSVNVEKKKVPIYKPFKADWNVGDLFYFKLNSESIYVTEEYKDYYVMMLIVSIYQKDWDVRYINSDISQVRFYFSKEKPLVKEDLFKSTPLCFSIGHVDAIGLVHSNIYTVDLLEKSVRKRPSLNYIGSFDKDIINKKIPQVSSMDHHLFFWGPLAERDLIWAYNKQKKLMDKKRM